MVTTLDKYLNANPTSEDAIQEARLFAAKTGFPKLIWAAIDGTHIKVHTLLVSIRHFLKIFEYVESWPKNPTDLKFFVYLEKKLITFLVTHVNDHNFAVS